MIEIKTLVITLIIAALALSGCKPAAEEENAQLPPMGWNSWNAFRDDITEDLIKETADVMIESGLVDAGYVYINIDDGWNLGSVQEIDLERFPGGINAISDYMHERGLKLGIYTRWNSIGNEERDAKILAGYGVDFIKNDAWRTRSDNPYWKKMHDAIKATGRPIVHSIHFNDEGTNPPNITEICYMWRITNDIRDYYNPESVPEDISNWAFSTLDIIDRMAEVTHLIEPGCFADADMFEIGNGNQTIDEYKTQFTMWSLLPAPLIMGHDVRNMSKDILEILTNAEVIAVNQDPAVIPAKRIYKTDDLELWARRLSGDAYSVVLLNKTESSREIDFSWRQIGLEQNEIFEIRDLWEHQDLGVHKGSFSVKVASHGCAMLKLSPR
ncbi:MAG: glycoside hydrolase family 27 protein [Bacteroidales bacterium]